MATGFKGALRGGRRVQASGCGIHDRLDFYRRFDLRLRRQPRKIIGARLRGMKYQSRDSHHDGTSR
ncbi:hypothetical protein [Cupriavidus metallidurans]|uniref:hypothetical protein n=1 Tax=Cupriavidus metallidurans TaxID=119219 RepID=UPI001F41AB18|nr:hypothetical protein [Cupriavidus metallidurans]